MNDTIASDPVILYVNEKQNLSCWEDHVRSFQNHIDYMFKIFHHCSYKTQYYHVYR